jgi:hypothetical protein
MTADRLILSAETYGTTFLLLRNQGAFPEISKLLGTRFSGNGDLINFAVRCSDDMVANEYHASSMEDMVRLSQALSVHYGDHSISGAYCLLGKQSIAVQKQKEMDTFLSKPRSGMVSTESDNLEIAVWCEAYVALMPVSNVLGPT